jgi:plasmid rolling circle replication initiator protein Rep
MGKASTQGSLFGGILDTLAQVGTNSIIEGSMPEKHLKGRGSNASNIKRQLNRAKKKVISQAIMLRLVDVATSKLELENTKKFWNTYHCQNKLTKYNGRLFGDYCKNRFCPICCGNRTADIINRYKETVFSWRDAHMVTLTLKSVSGPELKSRIKEMKTALETILSKNKKRAQRGKEIRLIGIRSFECTFNCEEKTYHPHIHFIVANRKMAQILTNEWMNKPGESYISPKAQDSRKISKTEKALIEVIKYGTKIFTEPTSDKKTKYKPKGAKQDVSIYVSAMYNIITAMMGLRIFERFGFTLPKKKVKGIYEAIKIKNYVEFIFDSKLFDWMNTKSREFLTGYKPPTELIAILTHKINISLE